MENNAILKVITRSEWRDYLINHHNDKNEIWIVLKKKPLPEELSYLDSVEEALCFGWIDGLAKSYNDQERLQRFTPRRSKSNWTELNKARAKRLIEMNLMTEAGLKVLPDLEKEFTLSSIVELSLKSDQQVWKNFITFPELYRRVRVGYIEEFKGNSIEFERRLNHFIKMTREGKMFGNWNDGGRLK